MAPGDGLRGGRARYLASPRADEPWLTSHLELRGPDGAVLPGYGWIFPLGNGEVNIGVGALATVKRPADVALRPLMSYYADLRRDEWGFEGLVRAPPAHCCRWAARSRGSPGRTGC